MNTPTNKTMSMMPKAKLTNGLVVANFSSGHPFTFEDGTVLPACQDDRVQALVIVHQETHSQKRIVDQTEYEMRNITAELTELGMAMVQTTVLDECNVIIAPRQVVEAIHAAGLLKKHDRFASIKMTKRGGPARIDVFCQPME